MTRFAWNTLGGAFYEGRLLDTDSNVGIVLCTDGITRYVEDYQTIPEIPECPSYDDAPCNVTATRRDEDGNIYCINHEYLAAISGQLTFPLNATQEEMEVHREAVNDAARKLRSLLPTKRKTRNRAQIDRAALLARLRTIADDDLRRTGAGETYNDLLALIGEIEG